MPKTKVDKLKEILKVLDPAKNTRVDFTEFDTEIAKLKANLTEKIQIQTLDDVSTQLEKFKKKLDLSGLLNAVNNLETSLDLKIQGLSGSLNIETITLNKLLQTKASQDEVSVATARIDSIQEELAALTKNAELITFRKQLADLQSFEVKANKTLKTLEVDFSKLESDTTLPDQIRTLAENSDNLRRELIQKINNIGGGAMNRQMFINGADPLTRYTDMNLKAGANVTLTYANNDHTKKVDVTISSTGGGGGGTVRSINSISTSQTAGATSGTDYVYLCTGTLTLTLPDATTNTNLYTIKNIGTGTITINTTSSQTIDDSLTAKLSVRYISIDLISDTANWGVT